MVSNPCVYHVKNRFPKRAFRVKCNNVRRYVVVQNYGAQSLGSGGGGLGYGGIPNGVAIELDTWFDAALRDPYENHLAVLTRG